MTSPSPRELRKFGLTVGLVLIGLIGLALPLLRHHALPLWPWPPGALLCLLALAWPASLAPIRRVWLLIGSVLGWINTRIILGVAFFVLVTPIGIIMRLFGKRPLGAVEPGVTTYRQLPKPSARKMEDPF